MASPVSYIPYSLNSRPYRVTSLIRNSPPPQGHQRALDMVLLKGPRGARFLMSEVPLYRHPLAWRHAAGEKVRSLQWYLAYKKPPPHRTLQ